jgi:hypothetical protein
LFSNNVRISFVAIRNHDELASTRPQHERFPLEISSEPPNFHSAVKVEISLFPIGRFFSREQRKQRDWLATNTDVITTQSHSLLACSR